MNVLNIISGLMNLESAYPSVVLTVLLKFTFHDVLTLIVIAKPHFRKQVSLMSSSLIYFIIVFDDSLLNSTNNNLANIPNN